MFNLKTEILALRKAHKGQPGGMLSSSKGAGDRSDGDISANDNTKDSDNIGVGLSRSFLPHLPSVPRLDPKHI